MPRRTNTFQRLIALVNRQLDDNAQVVESALLTDAITGGQREVDVLIKATIADYETHIAIECIDWKRKADVTWVEKMFQKHQFLSTNKLILVSRSGFSRNAIKKAEFHNILELTLEDAIDQNWLQKIKSVVISTCKLHIVRYELQLSDSLEDATIKGPPVFFDPEGNPGDLVGLLRAEIISNDKVAEILFDQLFDKKDAKEMLFAVDLATGIYRQWHLTDSRDKKHYIKWFRMQVKVEHSDKTHEVQHSRYANANIAFTTTDKDKTDILVMVEARDGRVTLAVDSLGSDNEPDETGYSRYRVLNGQSF